MTATALPTESAKSRQENEAKSAQPKPSGRAPVSQLTLAHRLLNAGRTERAMEILDHEMARGSDSAELQLLIGRAAFRVGDHTRAQLALRRAIELAPDAAEPQRWLARVLLRCGDGPGAMRALGSATRSSVPPALTESTAKEQPSCEQGSAAKLG